MRAVGSLVIGVVLAVLAVGLALQVVTLPAVTESLAARNSLSAEAGISAAQTLQLAEQTRAYVVDGEGELPASVGTREGFTPDAVSHLDDVRTVLAGARLATGVCAIAVMLWLGALVFTRRLEVAAAGFKAGGVATAVLVVLLVVLGSFDFEWLFSAFHGLFFTAGTWQFPSDSLLIELFPEPFWSAAGLWWGVVTVAFGALWWGTGLWLASSAQARKA